MRGGEREVSEKQGGGGEQKERGGAQDCVDHNSNSLLEIMDTAASVLKSMALSVLLSKPTSVKASLCISTCGTSNLSCPGRPTFTEHGFVVNYVQFRSVTF